MRTRPARETARPRRRALPRSPLWPPGSVPVPGALLDWRDSRHFHREDLSCVLCDRPTPLRSHYGEPAHKTCAEAWIKAHPTEARLGRFASDVQPTRKNNPAGDHA
ncbi:hypothetical protein ACIRP3_41650 [Streptomyces sp. NPDC101209]|uniref:hypothetical protein n=1 Tax=Streptomyces sp. NPDC101209 TaxID=3366129 RepID=UPI00381D8334